jgi:hypothetical protein
MDGPFSAPWGLLPGQHFRVPVKVTLAYQGNRAYSGAYLFVSLDTKFDRHACSYGTGAGFAIVDMISLPTPGEARGHARTDALVPLHSSGSPGFQIKVCGKVDGAITSWLYDYEWRTVGSARRPDGRIRRGSKASFAGNNIYNTTAARQVASGSTHPGGVVSFDLSLQNDAKTADRLRVRADGSARWFNVRYFHVATDITSAVIRGTYRTPKLQPGATHLVTVKVSVRSGAPPGAKLTRLVTTLSLGNPTRGDAVKYFTTRT